MTVENPNVRNTYGGNGSTTVFPFTFALNSEDVNNVEVVLTDTEGREARTTDFALSLNDKSVRYPKNMGAQPLPRGWKITLKRSVPYTQPLNLTSQGPFFAEDIEGQFDRQEMQIQQLAEVAERSVTVGFGADMTPEQFKQNFFDASKSAVTAANEARSRASEAAQSERNASDSKNSAATSASSAAQSARSAGDSKASAARSASSSAQSAAASEESRQASAESESKIKNMQVDVHAMQQHVDEVKTAIDGVAARAKADGQIASDAAVQAQRSAVVSAQSATASEASAKRAEQAAKFEGVVKSENLAEKSVYKKHLSFEVYDKDEVNSRVNTKVSKSGDTMTGMLVAPTLNTPIVNYIGERGYTWIKHGSKDSGDAITNNGANLEIGSWQGIGFYDTCDKRYTGTMNLRSGDWRTIGRIKADGGFEGALHGRADSAGNSDTLGGQSLQWILNQINAAKTGIIAGNLAQNGWVKFANGLIVQWGVGLPVNKEEYAVDFPIKFPSSCFGVWVTAIIEASKNHLSGVNGEFQVISANTAQCHLVFQQFNFPIQPAAPSILAIGI